MIDLDIFYGRLGPTAKQKLFRDATEKYKLFGGSVGGGKSLALSAEAIRLSLAFKGNMGFMARHEGKSFKNTTLITLLSLIAEIEGLISSKILHNHGKTDQILEFINGSRILYGGLNGPENVERVKSAEYGFYAVDEISECSESTIDMLDSRLRLKLPDGSYPQFFGLSASNPEPGWVKRRFVTAQRTGEKHPKRIFVQALPSDNPYLPHDYVDELRATKPHHWVERYLNGNWDALTGQIWEDFNFDIHVFPNATSNYVIPVPQQKRNHPLIIAAADHGQSNPTCFLAAYTDWDGNVFVYDEYYSPGLISAHSQRIADRFDVLLFETMQLDPSCWNTTGEKDGNPWSVADEYALNGLNFSKANNSVAVGQNRVADYLRLDATRIHPILQTVGSPRLFISARCVNLISELPEYVRIADKGGTSEQKETTRKRNDHACDALRYLMMTRPALPRKQIVKKSMTNFEYYKKMNLSKRKAEGVISVH